MPKAELYNQRILEFMDYCIYHQIKSKSGILPTTQGQFLTIIGFEHVGNLKQVKDGVRGFRLHHITNCCEQFGADANYFFLKQPPAMFINNQITPLQQLASLVKLLQLHQPPNVNTTVNTGLKKRKKNTI